MIATVHLDEASIEAVARRVVELSGARRATGRPTLVDVASLAEALSVTPSFVYAHQDELGVIRLGKGPHAPLRFDLEKLLEELTACSTSRESTPAPEPIPERKQPRSPRTASGAERELLPIKPRTGLK